MNNFLNDYLNEKMMKDFLVFLNQFRFFRKKIIDIGIIVL